MKVVVAPDSFKGSISAQELCAAVRAGIQAADPSAEVVELPMADGGEGTLETLLYAAKGRASEVTVMDRWADRCRPRTGCWATGKRRSSRWRRLPD